MVWGIRNVILSGLHDALNTKYQIYYCVPEAAKASMIKYGISVDRLIYYRQVKRNFILKRILIVLKIIHNKLHPTSSFELFKDENISSATNLGKMKVYNALEKAALRICSNRIMFSLLKRIEHILFDKMIDLEFLSSLAQLNAKFVLSTSSVSEAEWTLLRSMKKLDVPVYAHILSFDNLTSRGYLPIDYFDLYMVWNNAMKKELEELYYIKSDKIKITGTPQFDFHVDSRYRLSEKDVRVKLNLDDRPYLLYCANHYRLTPDEPILVETLIKLLQKDSNLKKFNIILRLHPMDQYNRWAKIFKKYKNVIRNVPWEHKNNRPTSWGEPTIDDLILFGNVLRYSSVMLNIASTVTIDAAIVNTPIICIGFHPFNDAEGKRYHDYHYSDHYNKISMIEAAPIAKSNVELLSLINKFASEPDYLSANREKLITEYLSENLLGRSSSLILDTIVDHAIS